MDNSFNSGLFGELQQSLPGNLWPVIPKPGAAVVLAILAQLESTQWLAEASLLQRQFRQLREVLDHARKTVPYYRMTLEGFDPAVGLDVDAWKKIPLLLRSDIQTSAGRLQAESLPSKQHEPLNEVRTSGSTGMPIVAYGTAVTRLFWLCFTLRDHHWHRRDMTKKIVAIRPEVGMDKPLVEADHWGESLQSIYRTGPSAIISSALSIDEQADLLIRQQPTYLLSLPTNIKELARYFAEHGLSLPGLEEVRFYGEVADEEVYEVVRQIWDVPAHDMYSSQEVGYIALQCHEHGRHHVQSENVLVEILDEHGNWCRPGETGRVVVTTLHNYAMPLIRYVLGDYAVAGEPCPCGRGLPVIEKVLGRERNMVTLPGGRRHYPTFPAEAWAHIAPIRQIQLVQKSFDRIEARLAMDRPMSKTEQQAFIEVIQDRMRHPFEIVITYHDRIPRSNSGKFEDFISELGSS